MELAKLCYLPNEINLTSLLFSPLPVCNKKKANAHLKEMKMQLALNSQTYLKSPSKSLEIKKKNINPNILPRINKHFTSPN